jgi:hypothetical protein
VILEKKETRGRVTATSFQLQQTHHCNMLRFNCGKRIAAKCLAAALLGGGLSSSDLDPGRLWGGSTLSIRYKSILHRSSNPDESSVDINVVLSRALPELDAKFLSKLLSLFCRDNLFIKHITLVSNQDLVNMDIRVLLDLGDPVTNRLERTTVRDVVHQKDALRSSEIRGCDRSETFLASSIPNLKLNLCSINVNVLDLEVNSNGGDESGTKRIVGVTEQEASLTNAGVTDHQQLDLNIVGGAS